MKFPCSTVLLLLHLLLLAAITFSLVAPSIFAPVLSSWRVKLTSPTYLSHEKSVYIKASVLFENVVSAGIPDNWNLSVLFNGNELRRFSAATVNFGVIVHEQQWVKISVCLVDSISRMVACDHATTLCIPETLSSLPHGPTAELVPVHVGTIGFHALAALPSEVDQVLSVSYYLGFILVAGSCQSRLCLLSTHNAVSGIWSLHSVGVSTAIMDSVGYSPSTLVSFHILESCAIIRLGFSYFRITLSDFGIDSVFPLLHFPTLMHIITCNIKNQCCFFMGSELEVRVMTLLVLLIDISFL
jgi:hypothetical protein